MNTALAEAPPHDLQAEASILSGLLRGTLTDTSGLTADSFYSRAHAAIFEALCGLRDAGRPLDLVVTTDLLRNSRTVEDAGGSSFLVEVAEAPASPATCREAVGIVARLARQRKTSALGLRLADGRIEAREALAELEALSIRAPVQDPLQVQDLAALSLGTLGLTRPEARWFMGNAETGGLALGKVALVAGHGGAGKSTLALQLAGSIASGRDLCGGAFRLHVQGPVLYLNAEDEDHDLAERLFAIREATGSPLDLENLYCVRGPGNYRLTVKDRAGNLAPSPRFASCLRLARQIKPAAIFIDPLSHFDGAADELDTSARVFVVALLRLLLAEAGAGALFCIAHVNKASTTAIDTLSKLENALHQNAVRGASATVDSFRWVLTMCSVPPALLPRLGASDSPLVAWKVCKSNQSATTDMRFFTRSEGGLLRPFEGGATTSDLDRVVEAVADHGGGLTARTAQDALHKGLGMSRHSFSRMLRVALDEGRLVEVPGKTPGGRNVKFLALPRTQPRLVGEG
jgi:replicative DNA helicase